ncbi:FAD binding domain-containing protein [Mycena crocata]|nr:FAD binding domain-containing protein [Mycena crocata]
MNHPTQNSSSFFSNFGGEDEVHPVLISGAGPAGTLLAFCLAKLGVRPLIVDSNPFMDHEWGRGDALLCRTVEVLRSLGVGETIIGHGRRISERSYWDMTADPPACKTISDFFPAELDIEDLYALAIRQGLVEKDLADAMTAICGATVHRPWSVVDVRVDDADPENQPVIATLKSEYGEIREVRARYVVGCDGGKSAVRRALEKYDVKLEGDAHDSVWSAIDIVGFKTDFPDTQRVSIVASAHGTVMIIPREEIHGRNCLRIYCEVDREGTSSLEDVVATIHQVFHPFTFTWDDINWFTIYTVGQRIASSFDYKQRIFLAGDAAHLHSPKGIFGPPTSDNWLTQSGALGMNTSLQDAHNLAIKLALVETGVASPAVLSTYALERRHVATHLVKMDAELIQIFADQGKGSDPMDTEKLFAFQREHFAFQAGTNITYAPNCMVDDVPHAPSAMAKLLGCDGLIVGRRLLPAMVRRFSDGLPQRILDAAPCDGRFAVFICFGDILATGEKAEQLAALRDAVYRTDGLWARLEARSAGRSALIFQLHGVTTTSHLSTEAAALLHDRIGLRDSSAFVSTRTDTALFDISTLYSDDIACLSPHASHTAVASSIARSDLITAKAAAGILLHPLHQKWDIDMEVGGIVVARPDGHVGTRVHGIDSTAWMKVEKYFEQFLLL